MRFEVQTLDRITAGTEVCISYGASAGHEEGQWGFTCACGEGDVERARRKEAIDLIAEAWATDDPAAEAQKEAYSWSLTGEITVFLQYIAKQGRYSVSSSDMAVSPRYL
jgi:hypothetical protein